MLPQVIQKVIRTISTVRCGLTLGILGWIVVGVAPLDAQAQAIPGPTMADVLEAEELGVSLSRIRRRLDALPSASEARSLLRLNYYVQVYGRTPPLDLFYDFDIHNSPISYGVPLHNEMLAVMHPNPLYPSSISLNPIAGWAWKGLRP